MKLIASAVTKTHMTMGGNDTKTVQQYPQTTARATFTKEKYNTTKRTDKIDVQKRLDSNIKIKTRIEVRKFLWAQIMIYD